MSGGSFNYLYGQDPYNEYDLKSMAEDLRKRGMYEASEATIALIQQRASEELAELWQAVEWHRSNDWGEAEVARAFVKWEATQTKRSSERAHRE
jgi:hypothetical protein